jgi:hypothetical protein
LLNRNHKGWQVIGLILFILIGASKSTLGKEAGQVQEITGQVEPKERLFYYTLPNLRQGQTLYVFMEGTSLNLDPFVALLKPGTDINTLREDYLAEEKRLVDAGLDPFEATPEVLKKFTLILDDDSGPGYDAVFTYHIPQDGDYQLVATSTLARRTFGNYRLLIGLNAPQVLSGRAQPTGDIIAIRRHQIRKVESKVEELFGNISPEEVFRFYLLPEMRAGGDPFCLRGSPGRGSQAHCYPL